MRVLATILIGCALKYVQADHLPPRLPHITPEKLERLIHPEPLLHHASRFLKFSELSNGTRTFGSRAHETTLRYIQTLLDNTGYYDVEFETFTYPYSEATAQLSGNGVDYPTRGLAYSPSGDVTAPVVVVNNLGCNATDYPEDVRGKIALVLRGAPCEMGLKVALAGAAGAIGAIVYNNADALPATNGSLGGVSRPQGPYVPSAYISGSDGKAIAASVKAGREVIANVKVHSFVEDRRTSNVIATTKMGDRDNVVVAGAHSDSVSTGPGLNDNASGSIGILEVALRLPKFSVKNAVRFAWWSAEEAGLVGSQYHVQQLSEDERQKIALYLNFDTIASPNGGFFVFDGDGDETNIPGPEGSKTIEDTYRDYFGLHNITVGSAAFALGSDYQPFVNVGIPAGGLQTGTSALKTPKEAEWWGGEAGAPYDGCYHLRCDGFDNMNLDMWTRNTKAIAWSIATYSRSLKGIPRGPRKVLQVSRRSTNETPVHQVASTGMSSFNGVCSGRIVSNTKEMIGLQ